MTDESKSSSNPSASQNLVRRLADNRVTMRIPHGPVDPALAGEKLDHVLTGDLTRDTRNVALLLETIHAFDSSHDIGEYLDRVVDMVVSMTSAERGILLLSEAPGQVKVVAARNNRAETIQEMPQFSRSLVRQVLQTGQPIFFKDTGGHERDVGESVMDLELQTVMCVPLLGRQGIIGVMYVDSRFHSGGFAPESLHFFEAICHQAAMTIEHARVSRYALESEGLAAIGEVAARLVEDLSRGARAIQGSAAMLQNFELKASDVKRIGGEVDQFITYIFDLLGSLESYAVLAEPPTFADVDLEALCRSALEQRQAVCASQGVEVSLEATSRPRVLGDPDKLQQALGAILDNAIQAMASAGRLTVRIGRKDDPMFEILISDTGVGIPPELQDRIFVPFVTSRPKERAGLGLSLAQRVVGLHGGEIGIQSDPQSGTDVIIRLPADTEAPA